MDTLHRAVTEQLPTVSTVVILAELVCARLAEKGITLSPRQRRLLERRIRDGRLDNIRIPTWRPWVTAEPVEIEFTTVDQKHIERLVERLVDQLPQMVTSLSDKFSGDLLRTLRKRWPQRQRYERRLARAFHRGHQQKWGHPLTLLGMLLTIASETGDAINDKLRRSDMQGNHVVDVQTRLHARACQVASEVLVLLGSGYADGAMARWRTLHEISVVAQLIRDDELLAERYALHEAILSKRAACDYKQYCQRLGLEALPKEEQDELAEHYRALLIRFGTPFKNDYGWAAERLHKERPTFRDIEQAVGIDHLRPYYRLAGHNVHADSKGVFLRLGLLGESDILLLGASDCGLADPGQLMAISLVQITSNLVCLCPTLDDIIAAKMILQLSHEVAESFAATEPEVGNEVKHT